MIGKEGGDGKGCATKGGDWKGDDDVKRGTSNVR